MKKNKWAAVYTALVTPFKNGKFDKKSFSNLVRFQVAKGIDHFVVSGTTAESPTISEDETKQMFKTVKTLAPDALILIGTGSYSTEETIYKTKKAERMGADGALVVTPYYNKPQQRGLIAHYREVSKNSKIPIVLYTVPSRTSVTLTPASVSEIAKNRNVVGIKEASGNLEIAEQISKLTKSNFVILSGDDETYLDLCEVGARGVISVLSNVAPLETRRWLEQIKDEKLKNEVRKEFESWQPFLKQLRVESNPVPVKQALQFMGVIQSAEVRLPLVEMEKKHQVEMKRIMKNIGIL
jgi:4-hydroxy-tetrahydrodipicolinate synthase